MSVGADINRSIHIEPTPEDVARLYASHGSEAAAGRWWWLGDRQRIDMARLGRVRLGWEPIGPAVRRRGAAPDVEAAAIEAAYAIGSGTAGELAADVSKSCLMSAFTDRGLDWPRISTAARRANTLLGQRAARGDAEATAAIEARLALHREIYRVCHAALALVPEQPAIGRPRMPEPSSELAAALSGFDPDAVAAVFPDLPPPPPAAPIEEPTVSISNLTPAKRMMPPDEEIQRQHALTPKPGDLAALWSVSESTVFAHLRRLGLTRPRGGPRQLPATMGLSMDGGEPVSIQVVPLPGEPRLLGRLDADGIALAVELTRRMGLSPIDALSWVRADAGLAVRDSRGEV